MTVHSDIRRLQVRCLARPRLDQARRPVAGAIDLYLESSEGIWFLNRSASIDLPWNELIGTTIDVDLRISIGLLDGADPQVASRIGSFAVVVRRHPP